MTPKKNGKELWQQRRAQWATLDWRLTDKELGEQMNVSRERARQIRLELGKPDSTVWPSEIQQEKRLQRVRALLESVRGKQVSEAARLLDCCLNKRTAVRRLLDANGALRPWRSEVPWHLFNFQLPDAVLSRTWGIGPMAVAKYRTRLGAGTPKWNGVVFRSNSATANDPAYDAALQAEQEQARQFKASA